MAKTICSACGAKAKVVVGDYRFEESGLRNVVLRNVEMARCAECGNEDVTIMRLDQLMRTLALALVTQPFPLDGSEVRYLRKYMHMTQAEFSALLGIHKTNLSKWESGDDAVGKNSDRLIRAVVVALSDDLRAEIAKVVRKFPEIQRAPERHTVVMDAKRMMVQFA